MSQDTLREKNGVTLDTGQAEPTLRDRAADAAMKEWQRVAVLCEHGQIAPVGNLVDAVMFVVQPELERLTAAVDTAQRNFNASDAKVKRLRAERDEARVSEAGYKAMVEKLGNTNKRLGETVANVQRIVAERDSELSRLRDALTRIYEDGCENFTTGYGSCIAKQSGRSRDGLYLTDRWCDPCIAYDALAGAR